MEEGVRIDKWLWAVRLYKTRTQATLACRSGKVRINDQAVKPSREVRPGEIVMIQVAPIVRTIRITELIENRVSAKLVSNYMEDMTPDEEYAKRTAAKENKFVYRQRGLGRPTKRERREIDNLKKYLGI